MPVNRVEQIFLGITDMARPRKIKTPKEFDELVDQYVAQCKVDDEPITWTGMALALGFYGKDELSNYAQYEGFSRSVKRARAIVERSYEARLNGNSPTGAIFALKNMGWSDRQELDHRSGDRSMSPQGEITDEDLDRRIRELTGDK